jgi:hypothetical protein
MTDDYGGMKYGDWLHEYERGVNKSLEAEAASILRMRGELSGDPMGDCKMIAERALVLQYS